MQVWEECRCGKNVSVNQAHSELAVVAAAAVIVIVVVVIIIVSERIGLENSVSISSKESPSSFFRSNLKTFSFTSL